MLVMMAIIPIYVGSAMSVGHMAHPDMAKSEVRVSLSRVDTIQLLLTRCRESDYLIQIFTT